MTYRTYLIGQGWPTVSGMAPSLLVSARRRHPGVYGEFRRTCWVYAAIWAAPGLAMNETDPSSVLPMARNGIGRPGRGGAAPWTGTFGLDRSPLPLATNRVWLSGLTATADGYQPTGM